MRWPRRRDPKHVAKPDAAWIRALLLRRTLALWSVRVAGAHLLLCIFWLHSGSRDDSATLSLAFVGGPLIASFVTKQLFSKSPRTVLVLRPFGEEQVSRSLKRLVRRTISKLGFTYTLEDGSIEHADGVMGVISHLLAIIPLLAWLRPIQPKVYGPCGIDELRGTLQATLRLSWWWVTSPQRIMCVRCSDAYWQPSVRLLMESADLIVLDISSLGVGTVWELEQLKRGAFARKTVLVAKQGTVSDGRAFIGKMWRTGDTDVYGYRADGEIVRMAPFLEAVAKALC